MEDKLDFSVIDETCYKQCLDTSSLTFKMFFNSYWRKEVGWVSCPCVIEISEWEDAKSYDYSNKTWVPLFSNFPIVNRIFHMEYLDNLFYMNFGSIDVEGSFDFYNATIKLINIKDGSILFTCK